MSKLGASSLGKLHGLTVHAIFKAAQADELPIQADNQFTTFSEVQQFTYRDALMIEVARQLHDDGGMPLAVASSFVSNSIDRADSPAPGKDHWIAMIRWRNTWGTGPRGSWPVTLFGPKEYWSSGHFAGSLHAVQSEIAQAIEAYSADQPDSDAARILMANVSAADRRLRNRAAEMGIDLD